MTFRVSFTVATFFNLDIDQMDVKTAFLYKFINQLVYIDIPKHSETEVNRRIVYKLLKTLYGFKQSPRLWYKRLLNFLLQKPGLVKINTSYSVFITPPSLDRPVVITFVNDIKIIASKISNIIA